MRKMLRRREYSFLTNSVERNADRSEFFRFTHPPLSRAWYASNLISTARRISRNLIFFFHPSDKRPIRKLNFRLQIRLPRMELFYRENPTISKSGIASVPSSSLDQKIRIWMRISKTGDEDQFEWILCNVTRRNFHLRDSLMMFPITICYILKYV